ncbi:MAG: deaminase [Candidatus Gracilibacteria bacterium]
MPLKKEDKKFLNLLKKTSASSRCLRAKVAAIVVKNGKMLLKADNSPHKCYDCKVMGCIRDIQKIPSGTKREICYGICAEQRLITTAAKKGISLAGATIYVTSHPCRICEGIIAESGIKRVVYIKGFPDVIPIYDTLKDFKLEVVQYHEEDDKPHEASTV